MFMWSAGCQLHVEPDTLEGKGREEMVFGKSNSSRSKHQRRCREGACSSAGENVASFRPRTIHRQLMPN